MRARTHLHAHQRPELSQEYLCTSFRQPVRLLAKLSVFGRESRRASSRQTKRHTDTLAECLPACWLAPAGAKYWPRQINRASCYRVAVASAPSFCPGNCANLAQACASKTLALSKHTCAPQAAGAPPDAHVGAAVLMARAARLFAHPRLGAYSGARRSN